MNLIIHFSWKSKSISIMEILMHKLEIKLPLNFLDWPTLAEMDLFWLISLDTFKKQKCSKSIEEEWIHSFTWAYPMISWLLSKRINYNAITVEDSTTTKLLLVRSKESLSSHLHLLTDIASIVDLGISLSLKTLLTSSKSFKNIRNKRMSFLVSMITLDSSLISNSKPVTPTTQS